jgi:hypothetical protein
MKYKTDNNHAAKRNVLRILGFIVLLVGVPLALTGFISFFSAFGTFQPPKYFWCAFIGLPMIGIGIALLKMGFLGAAATYVSDEVTPTVGKAAGHIGSEIANAIKDAQDPSARLEKLKQLKDQGLITEAEYAVKRQGILKNL